MFAINILLPPTKFASLAVSEATMKIYLTTVFVDDQEKALLLEPIIALSLLDEATQFFDGFLIIVDV